MASGTFNRLPSRRWSRHPELTQKNDCLTISGMDSFSCLLQTVKMQIGIELDRELVTVLIAFTATEPAVIQGISPKLRTFCA